MAKCIMRRRIKFNTWKMIKCRKRKTTKFRTLKMTKDRVGPKYDKVSNVEDDNL